MGETGGSMVIVNTKLIHRIFLGGVLKHDLKSVSPE